MIATIKNNNKFYLYIYYAIMLCIMTLSENIVFLHNFFVRALFTAAVFIPVMFKYRYLLPACFISFYTMMLNANYYPLVPNQYIFYFFIIVIPIIAWKLYLKPTNKIFLSILLLIFCINCFLEFKISNLFYTLLLFCFLFMYSDINKRQIIFSLANSYSLMSILLSISYILFHQTQLSQTTDEFTRASWMDQNYLSGMIGMGGVLSLIMLLKFKMCSLYFKMFWVVTIVFALMSQFLLASRGGLLATTSSVIFYFLFSKSKLLYKFIFICLVIILVLYFYYEGFLDYLIFRIQADDGSGSNRITIWMTKLNAFSITSSNIIYLIFGVGFEASHFLGSNSYEAIHNDFISFLCSYGISGLILLFCLLFNPLFKVYKRVKVEVLCLLIYILPLLLTLEPLSFGYMAYWGFIYLIYLISSLRSKDFDNNINLMKEKV